jgi:dipeptide/tripeptide permease
LHGWSNRNALILGLVITAAGNMLLGALAHAASYPLISLAMIVAGTGTGMLNPETAKTLQAQMPADRAGMASGIGATVRFISLLIGVAALGAVIAHFRPAVTAAVDVNAARGFAPSLQPRPRCWH